VLTVVLIQHGTDAGQNACIAALLHALQGSCRAALRSQIILSGIK